MIGSQIAHYRVTAKLGAGGMGEVYRATDAKLGRDVALKVLPASFAQDAQHMARFQREAQVLASLNHNNIAAIYGIEDGALVMELVDGPTLAERIAKGPIPLEEALVIAGQIVDALEAAHERGIIHRDLKPANIKVSPEGRVKVLDFGLAKALDEDADAGDQSKSPTLSMAATRAGMILGTAAYMSPEQARGTAVDRRSDIWSFGVVFCEMLTGKPCFEGETVSDTMAAVLRAEIPLDALPAGTPHHIRKLLRRCMERDRKRRLRDIGEARLAIEEYLASPADASVLMSAVSAPPVARWRRALPWALVAVLALALVGILAAWMQTPPPVAEVTRFEIDLGQRSIAIVSTGSRLAISPDGRRVVFVGTSAGASRSTRQLYMRSMDNLEIAALPGTEGAQQPFFSPDSQWLGFSAENKLKKIPVTGGGAVTLCEARANGGVAAAWSDNGSIFFSQDRRLLRIPEGGGTPEIIADGDLTKAERFNWVETLPGGRGVLVVVSAFNRFHIDVVDLESGKRQRLIESGSWPRYLPTGHLLYSEFASGASAGFTGTLMVVPFDLKTLTRSGSPTPVMESVFSGTGGAGFYDVSDNGTLVFRAGLPQQTDKTLAWLDRNGKTEDVTTTPRPFRSPALSPDSTRVAMVVTGATNDIQVYDLKRGTLQRLTFEGVNDYPVMTPDGKRVVYSSAATVADAPNLWWTAADGSGTAEQLLTSPTTVVPYSVSPDGKWLLYAEASQEAGLNIHVLPLQGERKPQPFLRSKFNEWSARFSPDGKWVAYTSTESGYGEIYVQAFPGPGGKTPISTGGGDQPIWSRDGKQLFYYSNDSIWVVDVDTRAGFRAGTPRVVAEALRIREGTARNWDVAHDGRILLSRRLEVEQQELRQILVVQNFLTEVRRRLPGNKAANNR